MLGISPSGVKHGPADDGNETPYKQQRRESSSTGAAAAAAPFGSTRHAESSVFPHPAYAHDKPSPGRVLRYAGATDTRPSIATRPVSASEAALSTLETDVDEGLFPGHIFYHPTLIYRDLSPFVVPHVAVPLSTHLWDGSAPASESAFPQLNRCAAKLIARMVDPPHTHTTPDLLYGARRRSSSRRMAPVLSLFLFSTPPYPPRTSRIRTKVSKGSPEIM